LFRFIRAGTARFWTEY